MSDEVTKVGAQSQAQSVPNDVSARLESWRRLWTRSAGYHYFLGVVSIAASAIGAAVGGDVARGFAVVAAVATALIGFMHPERRYLKFVRAWRVLDSAAFRYQHGLSDIKALLDAVERGETLISEFEEKVEMPTTDERIEMIKNEAPKQSPP